MSTRHVSARTTRAPALATLGPVVLLIACGQPVASAPATDPTGRAELNVILGRVTHESGDAVATARIRIDHYVDGKSVGTASIDTGSDGEYRANVPTGGYLVRGNATIDFNSQTYLFELVPTDGVCGEQESEAGIVKDFVLRLTGPRPCRGGPDVDGSYIGASIWVEDSLTRNHRPDAVIEFTLTPDGSLANGAPGQTLTMKRTVAALEPSDGPLGETNLLYDIPLAYYLVSAELVEPGGERVPLFVTTFPEATPVPELRMTFPSSSSARRPRVGYRFPPQLFVHDQP